MSETSNVVEVSKSDEGAQMPPADLPPPTPEEIVTPEVLDKIIKGYNPDCELVDFSAKLGTSIGDNYMSIMYAVKIQLKNRKSGELQTLDVMLKTMPRNAFRQQMINDCGAFIKDAKMYNEIFPEMISFQKEKGLKEEQIFKGWPQCYVTFHDGVTDYLGLEDLRVSGFEMANRHTGLDMNHTTLVLKSIAQFHAVTFAMFGGDFDKIMEKYPFLEEKMFMPESKMTEPQKMWITSTMNNESETVRKEGYPEAADLLSKVPQTHFWDRMYKLIGSKVKNAVINHGDCWTNNMMFTYNENNGIDEKSKISRSPNGLKFIDFQISRCSSRCVDLHYFMYSSPQMDILNNREDECLKIYFDEFSAFAQKLGVDLVQSELSWENFKEEYDSYRYYGVVMGLMLAPILAAEAKNVPDMEEIKEEDFTADGAKEFMDKLMGANSIKKICNMAVHHLPRCKELSEN